MAARKSCGVVTRFPSPPWLLLQEKRAGFWHVTERFAAAALLSHL